LIILGQGIFVHLMEANKRSLFWGRKRRREPRDIDRRQEEGKIMKKDILVQDFVRHALKEGVVIFSWNCQQGGALSCQLDWTPEVGVSTTWTSQIGMKSADQTDEILRGVDMMMQLDGVPQVIRDAAQELKELMSAV